MVLEATRNRRAWLGAGVAILVALGVAACDGQKAAETPPAPAQPPTVTVVKATRIEITPSLSFTGRIEAIDKVELRARVEGFIEKRLFQEGATVKPGELMFVMEKGLYQATVDQTQAELAGAQAQLRLADIETERTAQLVAKKVKAQQELDIAMAKQGEAKANVERAQAELEKAKLNLGFTDIFTPLAGRVGRRGVFGRRFRQPVERGADHGCQPGPDPHCLPRHLARIARRAQARPGCRHRSPQCEGRRAARRRFHLSL